MSLAALVGADLDAAVTVIEVYRYYSGFCCSYQYARHCGGCCSHRGFHCGCCCCCHCGRCSALYVVAVAAAVVTAAVWAAEGNVDAAAIVCLWCSCALGLACGVYETS